MLFPLMLACVVLKPNEIQTRNSPPTLRVPDDAPPNRRPDQFIVYNKDDGENALLLPIEVSDPDNETVVGRVFPDFEHGVLATYEGTLTWEPLQGSARREPIRIRSISLQTGRCYRITLYATRAFAPVTDGGLADERRPATEGDLTTMTWWVFPITNLASTPASLEDCP